MLNTNQLVQDQRSNFYDTSCLVSDLSQLQLESMKQPNKQESINNDRFEYTFGLLKQEDKVHLKVQSDSLNAIGKQTEDLLSRLDEGLRMFHYKNSVLFKDMLSREFIDRHCLHFKLKKQYLRDIACVNWVFDTLPGKHVQNWPYNQQALLLALEKMDDLQFMKEPLLFRADFFSSIQTYMTQMTQDKQYQQTLLAAQILYQFYIKSADIDYLLKLSDLHSQIKQLPSQHSLLFEQYVLNDLKRLENNNYKSEEEKDLHYMRYFNDQGAFSILANHQFSQQNFQSHSITTDGQYLYIYVTGVNGRMFKIGTGHQNTIAGKVYYKKPVSRQEQVSWVCINDRLYLRNSSRTLGLLEVLNVLDFSLIGFVQLNSPQLFSHQSTVNKNYPLLTDGRYLYVIGKKFVLDQTQKQSLTVPKVDAITRNNTKMLMAELKKQVNGDIKENQDKSINEEKILEQDFLQLIQQQIQKKKFFNKQLSQQLDSLFQKKDDQSQLESKKENLIQNKEESSEILQDLLLKEVIFQEIKQEESKELKEDQQPPQNQEQDKIPGEKKEEQVVMNKDEEIINIAEEINEEIKREIEQLEKVDGESEKHKMKEIMKVLCQEGKKGYEVFGSDNLFMNEFKRINNFMDLEKKEQEVLQQLNLQKEEQQVKQRKAPKKTVKAETKPAISEQQQSIKVVEFILYAFDLEQQKQEDSQNIIEQDDALVQELFESFGGFYSLSECAKALSASKEDISEAAAHLVDETDKNLEKLIVSSHQSTLLCQSHLTLNDLNLKNLPKTKDFPVKENSLIYYQDVEQENWTMNKDYLSLYVDQKVHIFSTHPEHVKVLPDQIKEEENNKEKEKQKEEEIKEKSKEEEIKEKLKEEEKNKLKESKIQVIRKELETMRLTREGLESKLIGKQDEQDKEVIHENKVNMMKELKELYEKEDLMNQILYQEQQSGTEKKVEKVDKGKEKGQLLKGSYIKSLDFLCFKQNRDKICYDPVNCVFYQFNWTRQQQKCVLPSLVTVSYDYNHYQSQSVFSRSQDNNQSFESQLASHLIKAQKHRFSRPYVLNDIYDVYRTGLLMVQQDIDDIKSSGQKDKQIKKYNDLKAKIQNRLNKYNTIFNQDKQDKNQKQADLLELKPKYAYCVDGKFINNVQIIQQINKTNDDNVKQLMQELLLLNLKHSDVKINIPQKQNQQIVDYLNVLYEKNNKQQLNEVEIDIIVYGFNVFLYSVKQKVEFMVLILQNNKILDKFFDLYYRHNQLIDKQFAYKQNQIIDKSQDDQVANLDYRQFNFCLGNFMMNSIDHYKQVQKIYNQYEYVQNMVNVDEEIEQFLQYQPIFMECICKQFETQNDIVYIRQLNRIIQIIFIEGQQQIKKIDDNKLEVYRDKQQEIFMNYIKIISRILINDNLNHELEKEINVNVKLLSYSLIQSIQTQQYSKDMNIEMSLIELIKQITVLEQKIKKIKQEQQQQQQQQQQSGNQQLQQQSNVSEWEERESNEGVNESESVICETNHPYERGRVIKFETVRFSANVIGVQLVFDSRCSSDYDNDFLVVSSWYDHEQALPINYDNKNRSQSLSNCVSVTGKIQGNNRVHLLLGNNVQVDFNTSGMAKCNTNLLKWGYKVTLKPLYCFGSQPIQQTLSLLTIALQDINRKYLHGHSLSSIENTHQQYLGWNLLKNSHRSYSLHKYINPSTYILTQQFQQQLQQLNTHPKLNLCHPDDQARLNQQLSTLSNQYESIEVSQEVKDILDQINNNQGEYQDKLTQINAQVKEPMQLTRIKMRSTFNKSIQLQWEQMQLLFLLACFYHKNEIKTLMKDSIPIIMAKLQAPLQEVTQARNQILFFMIQDVNDQQMVNASLQEIVDIYNTHLIIENQSKPIQPVQTQQSQSIIKQKGKQILVVKTKKSQKQSIQQPTKKPTIEQSKYEKCIWSDLKVSSLCEEEMRKSLDRTFAGNDAISKKICNQLDVQYLEEEPKKCLDELLTALKSHLMTLSERCIQTGELLLLERKSVYQSVAEKVIKTIMFTLQLEANQNTLKPLGLLNRSFSCPSQYQHKQQQQKKTNLLQIIRYTQRPQQQLSYESSEVEHIIYGLVKHNVDTHLLSICIHQESMRAVLKLKGLYINRMLQNTLDNKPTIQKYIYIKGVFKHIQSCNKTVRAQIEEHVQHYINTKIQAFNLDFQKYSLAMNQVVKSKAIPQKSQLKQYLKQQLSLLQELIENILQVQYFSAQFVKNLLQLGLLCISVTYLGHNHQELAHLSRLVHQNICLLITKYTNNSQVAQMVLEQFHLEIGYRQDTLAVNVRVLERVQDILVMDRIQFLLNLLYDKKISAALLEKSSIPLALLMYYSQSPHIILIVSKLLHQHQSIKNCSILPSLSFYSHSLMNLTELKANSSHLPEYQKVLYSLPNEFLSSQPSLMNMFFYKLGETVLYRNHSNPLRLMRTQHLETKKVLPNSNGCSDNSVVVMVHLYQEEDVSFLLRVFFYWEQMQPTFTAKYPKTFCQYLEQKKAKEANKNTHSKVTQSSSIPSSPQIPCDRLLSNLAQFNNAEEKEEMMPVGWQFLTLPELAQDMKANKLDQKKMKLKNINVKRVSTTLIQVEKKFEEYFKTLEEPKETDSDDIKNEFIRAHNWIHQLLHHLKEVYAIAAVLNQQGFTHIQAFNRTDKLALFKELLQMGINQQLSKIDIKQVGLNEKNSEKLDIETQLGNKARKVSQMKVSECSYKLYKQFDLNMNQVANIQIPPTTSSTLFYNESNRNTLLHKSVCSGYSAQIIIQECIQLLSKLDKQELKQKSEECLQELQEEPWENINTEEQCVIMGALVAIGGWDQQIQRGSLVTMRDNQYVVVQGGPTTGTKSIDVLSKQDHGLTVQQVDPHHQQVNLNSHKIQVSLPFSQLVQVFLSLEQQHINKQHDQQQIEFEHQMVKKGLLEVLRLQENTENVDKQLVQKYVEQLMVSSGQPMKKKESDIQQEFISSWARLGDRLDNDQQHIVYYQEQPGRNEKLLPFQKEEEQKEDKIKIMKTASKLNLVENYNDQDEDNFILPLSNYQSSLPEVVSSVQEHKMLKYWEKHVIPKLMDFTKSSFKAYEFEDYFEQLRQPLRLGNQNGAAVVAFIICENRLPSGVILPDENHDWSTISLEEIQVGQYVMLKLANKHNQVFLPLLTNMAAAGVHQVLAQVLALETKSNSALVQIVDHWQSQLYTVWVPVIQLKAPEIALQAHPNFKSIQSVHNELSSATANMISILSRKCILKVYDPRLQQGPQGDLPLEQLLSYYSQDVLKDDPVSGWLSFQKDSLSVKKPSPIGVFLSGLTVSQTDSLLIHLESLSQSIYTTLVNNSIIMDFQKEGDPVPLASLMADHSSIQGLTLSFQKDSQLCGYSELKFFEDSQGISLVAHYSGGKEIKKHLPPLLFNNTNIYAQYIFNSGALPPYMQDQQDTRLQFVLQGVPREWGVFNWLMDQLSSACLLTSPSAAYSLIHKLITLTTQLYQRMRGPSLLKEQLLIQLKRQVLKIRHVLHSLDKNHPIHQQQQGNLDKQGIDKAFLKTLIQECDSRVAQQKAESSQMLSKYVQQQCELCALVISSMKSSKQESRQVWPDGPNWLYQLADLYNIVIYLRGEHSLSNSIKEEVHQQISLDIQWDRIIYVENLPTEWTVQYINQKICDILQAHNSRVLNVHLDIVNLEEEQKRSIMIFLDGWVELDMEEQMREQIEQEKEEEQKEEEVEEEGERLWNCDICTLQNPFECTKCEACESPRPANYQTHNRPEKPEKEQKQKTDLDEIANRRKKKDQERFEKIIFDIHSLIQGYYLNIKSTKEARVTELSALLEQQQQQDQKQESKQQEVKKKEKPGQKGKDKSSKVKAKAIQLKSQQEEEIMKQEQERQQKEREQKGQEYMLEIETLNEWINEEYYNMECLIFCGKNIPEIKKKQFQEVLVNRLKDSDGKLKEQVRKELDKDTETISQLEELVKTGDGMKAFSLLQELGYDFWMQKSGIAKGQQHKKVHLGLDTINTLKRYIEVELCKQTKTVLVYSGLSIRFPKDMMTLGVEIKETINMDDEMRLGTNTQQLELRRLKLVEVRQQWEVIKMFNRLISETLDLISMDNHDLTDTNQMVLMNLGSYLALFRDLWMSPIRVDLSQTVLQKTAVARENVPKVKLERLKLSQQQHQKNQQQGYSQQNSIDKKDKEMFAFTKAFEQIQNIEISLLRPIKPKGTDPFISFEVVFQGENVMGETGPYRQFFADISRELQGKQQQMGLFIETPNNNGRYGEELDKYMINPGAGSTYQLQLFEYLGILMGCCVRTGVHLTLDLPQLFWKQLVGQQTSVTDLAKVDKAFENYLQMLQDCDESTFQEDLGVFYTVSLSNGVSQELVPGGAKIQVAYKDRQIFIDMLIQARVKESHEQMAALRRGLQKIVPTPLLNSISGTDLEIWVAGKSKVDFQLLRRHTRYGTGLTEDSDIIKHFWQVLSEFNAQESIRFVKFCWGQERLPANDEEFERFQIRFMVKHASHYKESQKDHALPKSDTCFFNLQLPSYSSKKILKERLLIAINTDCDSLNAEDQVNLDPNAQEGDQRDYSFYEEDDYQYNDDYDEHDQEEEEEEEE